ncbi:MAG: HD-GYP domain-containing protein [Methylophilaceae bacterium]|nr:HD-GYP domain-containing protein [Methylophilaceae bacterium]
MANLKKQLIEVDKLAIGMFVTELDIPWLDSPFLLQGFIIETDDQISALKNLCKIIWVDRTKSAGFQFVAPKKEKVAIIREGAVIRLRASTHDPASIYEEKVRKDKATSRNTLANSFSFLDILRELRNNPTPQLTSSSPSKVLHHVQNMTEPLTTNTNAPSKYYANNQIRTANLTIAQHLKKDIKGLFSNLLGGVLGLMSKKEKLKTNVDWFGPDNTPEIAGNQGYRITIFEDEAIVEDEIATIYPIYEKSQIATRELFNNIANKQNLDLSQVSEIIDSMVSSIQRAPDALMWLAKLKITDDYSYNHALNVSINLMAFASFLSLSKKQIKELGMAGLLQDIGKINIPSDILLKPNQLTPEELQTARSHVDEGLSILEKTLNIPSGVIFLVAQHHERIDGSGYPYQLTGNQISLQSQIAGLIDTYCAITSDKPYAKGLFNQQALEKINLMSGQQFSNTVVDQLVQFLGIYPVSSLVELNTGEIAVVIQQNQVRRLLPRVLVLLAPDKTRNEHPATINLLNAPLTPSGEPYTILHGVAPDAYGLNAADFYV